jgi:hypothetical protein
MEKPVCMDELIKALEEERVKLIKHGFTELKIENAYSFN